MSTHNNWRIIGKLAVSALAASYGMALAADVPRRSNQDKTAVQYPSADSSTRVNTHYGNDIRIDITCDELLKRASEAEGYPVPLPDMATVETAVKMLAQATTSAEMDAARAAMSKAMEKVDQAKLDKTLMEAAKKLIDAKDDASKKAVAMMEIEQAMAAMPDSGMPQDANDMTMGEVRAEAIQAVKERAAEARYLRLVWDALGEYPSGDFSLNGSLSEGDKLLMIRRTLSACAQQTVLAARAAAKLPGDLGSANNEQLALASKLTLAEDDYFHIAKRTLFDEPQLSVFAGASYALDSKDKFKAGAETLVLFDGGAGSAFGIGRAITEIAYRSNGSVNYAGPVPEAPAAGAPPLTESALYREDPGYARINIGYSSVIADRYSIALAGGLTAIPGIGGSFPDALRPRGEVSILGRSFYGRGLYSRISAGYAYDTYWRNTVPVDAANLTAGTEFDKSYHRARVQALVMLPVPAISPNFAGAARLSVDTPLNGDGPSEVRLSILLAMDFADFFGALVPKPAAAAP